MNLIKIVLISRTTNEKYQKKKFVLTISKTNLKNSENLNT